MIRPKVGHFTLAGVDKTRLYIT